MHGNVKRVPSKSKIEETQAIQQHMKIPSMEKNVWETTAETTLH